MCHCVTAKRKRGELLLKRKNGDDLSLIFENKMKTVGPGCVVAALLLGAREAPPRTGWVPTRRAVLHAAAASLLTAAPSLAAAAAVTAATDGSASGRATSSGGATSALDIPFDWSFAYSGGARIGAGSAPVSAPKRTGLTTEAIASELRRDLSTGKYILTGDLTAELFRDECHFEDPNNAVDGLQKYRQALSLLFDPNHSELRVGVTSHQLCHTLISSIWHTPICPPVPQTAFPLCIVTTPNH